MKICSIEIKNFKAIKYALMSDLEDMVIIAGGNGCGKSSIFEAIRIVKTAYGVYQTDERNQLFTELQIDMNNPQKNISKLLHDVNEQYANIKIVFSLSQTEKEAISFHFSKGRKISEEINQLVYRDTHTAEVTISERNLIQIKKNVVLERAFSIYDPNRIGIIDFYSSKRIFNKENLGGVQFNDNLNDMYQRGALYNTDQKYNQIKRDMANAYIRNLILEKANQKVKDIPMVKAMQKLFEVFFPDKSFAGPLPTNEGLLSFAVKTKNGVNHDIDELSSGEKEIIIGYMRLLSNSPNNSIVLIDEPELHLNPKTAKKLPSFYKEHLAKEKSSQVWLITHSDAILRGAENETGLSTFYMRKFYEIENSSNQMVELSKIEEFQSVLFELVGEVITYSSSSTVVIFEGGGNTHFDVRLIQRLFPEESQKMIMLSGESKNRVKELHKSLTIITQKGILPFDFFCITDMDSEDVGSKEKRDLENCLSWDVYHIENYLLNSHFICEVLNGLNFAKKISIEEVDSWLLLSAKKVLNEIIIPNELWKYVRQEFQSRAKHKINKTAPDKPKQYHAEISNSTNKLCSALSNELSEQAMETYSENTKERFEKQLNSGEWKYNFPGRDVLKEFTKQAQVGVSYEKFRNLIISKMVESSYRPEGIEKVLSSILNR